MLLPSPPTTRSALPLAAERGELPLPVGTAEDAASTAAIQTAQEDATEGVETLDGDDLADLLQGFDEGLALEDESLDW
jgi:hypothetical protein